MKNTKQGSKAKNLELTKSLEDFYERVNHLKLTVEDLEFLRVELDYALVRVESQLRKVRAIECEE
jgi:hypothetical protein